MHKYASVFLKEFFLAGPLGAVLMLAFLFLKSLFLAGPGGSLAGPLGAVLMYMLNFRVGTPALGRSAHE